MSPILKREVAETVRQARRLAAAAGLREYDEHEYELDHTGVSRYAEVEQARLKEKEAERAARIEVQNQSAQDRNPSPRDSLDLSVEDIEPLLDSQFNSPTAPSSLESKLHDFRGLLFSVSVGGVGLASGESASNVLAGTPARASTATWTMWSFPRAC